MSETPKSKGEMIIERIMRELDPGSERYQVLATAKRFKSSWVELGEKLLLVSRQGLFRSWGYESFEEYCTREIHIKQPTARKLTLAYRFMEKEEPELMARQTELKPPPDYRSVDLLRQAQEEKDFSPEEYAELRRAVVEEERSHPTILKRFKEVAAGKPGHEEDPLAPLRAALGTARRLESMLLGASELPTGLAEQAGEIAGALEEALRAGAEPEARS
jgi:hypothetical protein